MKKNPQKSKRNARKTREKSQKKRSGNSPKNARNFVEDFLEVEDAGEQKSWWGKFRDFWKNQGRVLEIFVKIFVLGLLLQFFAWTVVTRGLGLDGLGRKIVRARKEVLLVAGLLRIVQLRRENRGLAWWEKKFGGENSGKFLGKRFENFSGNSAESFEISEENPGNFWEKLGEKIVEKKNPGNFWKIFGLRNFVLVLGLTMAVALVVSLVAGKSLGITALSMRYSFAGFGIFVLGWGLGALVADWDVGKILDFVRKVLQWSLVGGVVWRVLITAIPTAFRFLGYDPRVFEGEVGARPPVAYFTDINGGFVRNQFLFERPISWGFALVALWPLLRWLAVRGKSWKKSWIRVVLFLLNLLSTFSRAAWIAWLVQVAVIAWWERDPKILRSKHFWKIGLAVAAGILLLGSVARVGRRHVIERSFSTVGHVEHTLRALEKIGEKPLLGWGAGTTGPAAHHGVDATKYNAENQFLQIWIEYGFFGFLGWMVLWVGLRWKTVVVGLRLRKLRKNREKILSKNEALVAGSFVMLGVGLLGLGIEGLVLHSRVDRMIVYPVAILLGLTGVATRNIVKSKVRGEKSEKILGFLER